MCHEYNLNLISPYYMFHLVSHCSLVVLGADISILYVSPCQSLFVSSIGCRYNFRFYSLSLFVNSESAQFSNSTQITSDCLKNEVHPCEVQVQTRITSRHIRSLHS